MQSIKELNLKANHNQTTAHCIRYHTVCNLSKNSIWKQITTNLLKLHEAYKLYAIYQRTQSESKSQQLTNTNLAVNTVCNLSKNSIWKQITTDRIIELLEHQLYAIYQRTQSESKSQQQTIWCEGITDCMQSIKELNLKANHNIGDMLTATSTTVCNLSKNSIWKQITTGRVKSRGADLLYAIYQRTQSESKSQLAINNANAPSNCMQSIKELNLKANHN